MRVSRVGLAIAAALLIAAVVLLTTAEATASLNRIVYGNATTYGDGYAGWLALPTGPGHRVRICSSDSGHRRCVTQTSNDTGPRGAGRIADLDVPTFELLCGCEGKWRQVGVIEVSVEYLTKISSIGNQPTNALPATDTE